MPEGHDGRVTRTLRAVLLGGLLAFCAAGLASSEASVNMPLLAGRTTCWAVPAPDGAYTAAHCVAPGVTRFNGSRRVPPCSVDPARDLGHCASGANPGVTLRAPVAGETAAALYPGGTVSRYVFQGLVDGRAYTAERTPGEYQLWCWQSGKKPVAGMSGSGYHADSDGALVAVMTNGGPTPVQICASGYASLGLGVP